jgi:hypothetical protein
LDLPWIGAFFRIDPLAALFLAVVDFGTTAAASRRSRRSLSKSRAACPPTPTALLPELVALQDRAGSR